MNKHYPDKLFKNIQFSQLKQEKVGPRGAKNGNSNRDKEVSFFCQIQILLAMRDKENE